AVEGVFPVRAGADGRFGEGAPGLSCIALYMTREENTAMFERRYENWNRRDTAALIQDLAENSVVESPLAGGPTRGRRAIEELHKTFFAAFPDERLRFDELLIDGHHVMG